MKHILAVFLYTITLNNSLYYARLSTTLIPYNILTFRVIVLLLAYNNQLKRGLECVQALSTTKFPGTLFSCPSIKWHKIH